MNVNNKRVEKTPLIGTFTTLFVISIVCLISYIPTYYGLTIWWEKMETTKYIWAWAITYFTHLFFITYSIFNERETENKWEIQNQKDIQKATENVKKELLETKTELLLTQNKLREKEESLLDSSEKKGESVLGEIRKETKKKENKTKKRTQKKK